MSQFRRPPLWMTGALKLNEGTVPTDLSEMSSATVDMLQRGWASADFVSNPRLFSLNVGQSLGYATSWGVLDGLVTIAGLTYLNDLQAGIRQYNRRVWCSLSLVGNAGGAQVAYIPPLDTLLEIHLYNMSKAGAGLPAFVTVAQHLVTAGEYAPSITLSGSTYGQNYTATNGTHFPGTGGVGAIHVPAGWGLVAGMRLNDQSLTWAANVANIFQMQCMVLDLPFGVDPE
jgi:hypothetical protein